MSSKDRRTLEEKIAEITGRLGAPGSSPSPESRLYPSSPPVAQPELSQMDGLSRLATNGAHKAVQDAETSPETGSAVDTNTRVQEIQVKHRIERRRSEERIARASSATRSATQARRPNTPLRSRPTAVSRAGSAARTSARTTSDAPQHQSDQSSVAQVRTNFTPWYRRSE
jgi:hypothetical protein